MQTQGGIAAQVGQQALTLQKVTDLMYLTKLRGVLRDLSHDEARNHRFPGPNPVSLDSGHFAKLSGEPYYVCEKTDGVRYMMVCCTMEAPEDRRATRATVNVCALVDRALNAYLLPIGHLPKAAYQGSLFDGEVAFNKVAGGWEFIIFDAIYVSGVPVLECTLRDRLDAVHRVLRVYSTATGAAPRTDPVALRVKNFVAVSKMDDFERMLPGLRESYDIDGVILTPALPAVTYGRHHGMFKLKFDSRHTVDFLVAADGRGLSVFDNGGHAQVGHIAQAGQAAPPGSIAECALEVPGTAQWTVVTLRTDKATANDMYTYQKTMLNMRENLTLEHVKRACAGALRAPPP